MDGYSGIIGYKLDIRCKDGRTIRRDGRKHHDGEQLPLVRQHQHGAGGTIGLKMLTRWHLI